jgi:hypothetical protein
MSEEAGPKGMSRRDFLEKSALGLLSLGALGRELYSDGIEDVYKGGDQIYAGKRIVILDFQGQGDSQKGIVPSKGFDLDKTIPSMLKDRLQGNGIKILSNYVINAKLKKQGMNFDDILANPLLAEELGVDGCITGTYTIFRGPPNDKINAEYIDLRKGDVEFSCEIEDSIPFRLAYMIDEISNKIVQFLNNKDKT